MRAAVLQPTGRRELELRDDVTAVGPDAGEVRIRIRATGVCHSDLSVIRGGLPSPDAVVVGHEGAGEVIEVGSGVTAVRPGDRVLVNWIPACRQCPDCLRGEAHLCMTHMATISTRSRFRIGTVPAYGMAGAGTWAEEIVVPWEAAVRVDDDLPFEHAALLSCGVSTGLGAVFHTARVRPGSSVAVIGTGGVGLCAVQGARIAGAALIVAVDPLVGKHPLARTFGATHTLLPDDLDDAVKTLTGGRGFDHVIEAVGTAATIERAWRATRRGGDTVVVGAGTPDDLVQINAFELLFQARNILPSVYGGCDLRRDLPGLVALYRSGMLDIESLISERIGFADLNRAVARLASGAAVRQVVLFE